MQCQAACMVAVAEREARAEPLSSSICHKHLLKADQHCAQLHVCLGRLGVCFKSSCGTCRRWPCHTEGPRCMRWRPGPGAGTAMLSSHQFASVANCSQNRQHCQLACHISDSACNACGLAKSLWVHNEGCRGCSPALTQGRASSACRLPGWLNGAMLARALLTVPRLPMALPNRRVTACLADGTRGPP